MKLNPDCIRDILITVEENTSFGVSMEYRPNNNSYTNLDKYSDEEVFYHVKQCQESFLISNVSFCSPAAIYIGDLTPKGHEFLANIRSDTVWNNTKTLAGKIGSYSLGVLTNIAVGVLTQMINKQLGY